MLFRSSFYNVHRAFPRSGPSDGKGGVILVSGQGFRPDKNPMCRLNGTEHKPIAVSQSEIKCPMPPAEEGAKYFGNVDFAVSPNGEFGTSLTVDSNTINNHRLRILIQELDHHQVPVSSTSMVKVSEQITHWPS